MGKVVLAAAVLLAAGAAPAHAASPLSAAGVSASHARTDGRALSVRVTLKNPTTLRANLVAGRKTSRIATRSLAAGIYELRLPLPKAAPTGPLKLGLSAVAGSAKGSGTIALARVAVPKKNVAPSAIVLSRTSVLGDQPAGLLVGTLTGVDDNLSDRLAFRLVKGAGATDNALFRISGARLKTASLLAFTAPKTYAIRVEISDGKGGKRAGVLRITLLKPGSGSSSNGNDDPNGNGNGSSVDQPADIALSTAAVAENRPAGTTVGTLSAPNATSFALVAGTGDTDNASFTIDGTALKTAASYDKETKAAYTVRVKATRSTGAALEKAFAITVTDVNDAPIVTTSGGAVASYTEQATPAAVIDNAVDLSDVDNTTLASFTVSVSSGFVPGDQLVFTDQGGITGSYNATTGVLTLTGAASLDAYRSALRTVGFRSSSDDPGTSRAFTFVANDGTAESAPAVRSLTVVPVDDAPVVTTGDESAPSTFTENNPPAVVDPRVTVSDPDSPITGATVAFKGQSQKPEDALSAVAAGPLSATYNAATGVLTVTGTASAADYQAFLRSVLYNDTSDTPDTTDRTLTFRVGNTADSNAADRKMHVVPTDDPAVVTTTGSDAEYTERASAIVIDPGVTVSDVDGTTLQAADVTLSAVAYEPGDTLGITAAPPAGTGITATVDNSTGFNAAVRFKGSSSLANYQAAIRSVTFSSTQANPQKLRKAIGFSVIDAGGKSSGSGRSIAITPVNDPPDAKDDTLQATNAAIGNTTLVINHQTGSTPPAVTGAKKPTVFNILGNDSNTDDPASQLQAVAQTVATAAGGTARIEADGDVVYTPKAGTSCTAASDSFVYTVTDGAAMSPKTDTATVTVPQHDCVWYVDNSATAPGTGTSAQPFTTLAAAQNASSAGNTIYLFDGTNTTAGYDAGLTLKTNQRLIGEPTTLLVGTDTLFQGVGSHRPTITNTAGDALTLAPGASVQSVGIDPQGNGGGIFGGSAVTAAASINDVRVEELDGVLSSQPSLDLDGTTGLVTVSQFFIDTHQSPDAVGIRLNNTGTVDFPAAGQAIQTGNMALTANGAAFRTGSTFVNITATSAHGGIGLINTTGDVTFSRLKLTTTGSEPAFAMNNAANVKVGPDFGQNLNATNGPVVDVRNSTGANLAMGLDTSTNSPTAGINIDNLSGTFSSSGGSLSGAANDVDINGGSGAISLSNSIGFGTGNSLRIRGRTGGTVTFGGTINDGSDAGGGVVLSGNTGGSTVISAPYVGVDTGSGDGISLVGNSGHTVQFTAGNLHATTTTGRAFDVSGGGTVEVAQPSSPNNTLASGTGRALSVVNSTIGAGGLTFSRIDAKGGAQGIVLNTTGTTGGLTVTGTGGTCTVADTTGCSGGTISSGTGADDSAAIPVGTGIALNATGPVSLTRMWLHDFSNYAIRSTGSRALALNTSVVGGAIGDTATSPYDDSAIAITDPAGQTAITSSAISGGLEDGLRVSAASGTADVSIAGSTFGPNASRTSDAGVLVSSSGSGAINAGVTNTTFSAAGNELLRVDHNGTGNATVTVDKATFFDQHPAIASGHGGVLLRQGATSGRGTFSVTGSSFRGADGPAFSATTAAGNVVQTGTFSGNTVGVSATGNSGSKSDAGFRLLNDGIGSQTWTIANNTILQTNFAGIAIEGGLSGAGQNGVTNTTITGNTVGQPGTTNANVAKLGVYVGMGSNAGDGFAGCTDLSNNTLANSGTTYDVGLFTHGNSTMRLPGYTGDAPGAAVPTYLAGRNSGLNTSRVSAGSAFTNAGASC